MESSIGSTEPNSGSFASVVDDHVKTSADGDEHLMEGFVSVTGASLPARDIVEVVHALDLERDVSGALDEREAASLVTDERKLEKLAANARECVPHESESST